MQTSKTLQISHLTFCLILFFFFQKPTRLSVTKKSNNLVNQHLHSNDANYHTILFSYELENRLIVPKSRLWLTGVGSNSCLIHSAGAHLSAASHKWISLQFSVSLDKTDSRVWISMSRKPSDFSATSACRQMFITVIINIFHINIFIYSSSTFTATHFSMTLHIFRFFQIIFTH